jgi:hypothetical protein
MALIPCPECKAQISDKAKACPSCGAKPPRSHAVLYALLGIPVIFLTWALVRTPDVSEVEQNNARDAIRLCWDDQKTKSYAPSTSRFVASVCEKMESEYKVKYRSSP